MNSLSAAEKARIEVGKPLPFSVLCPLSSTRTARQARDDSQYEGNAADPESVLESRHPRVAFYGLKFGELSETDALVLHGCVSSHLLAEFHSLWQDVVDGCGADARTVVSSLDYNRPA